ncbi:hypothetical protein I4U23_012552 [Adineta vaga]|nr:hypothetical protein I4U23_012552 [Adineta vaga]
MGGGSSRRKQPNVAFPQLPQYPQYPPTGILLPPPRPASPVMSGIGGPSTLNRKQLRQYEDAQRTIQNFQSQMQQGRAPSPRSYSGPPIVNASGPSYGSPYPPSQPPPMPYGGGRSITPPPSYAPPAYPPPSPILQRLAGNAAYPYQPTNPFGPAGYRDSDYAAVANISGLNPADVALLHREYLNLTRGGANKIDRVVFRQLLREALLDANNENIDRAIENIFVAIDRNRDGFIDFPEFVGAFRDVLRTGAHDPHSFLAQYGVPETLANSIQTNVATPIYLGQANACNSSQPQIISLPSTNIQQAPLVYNGSTPLVLSLDANQSPYIVNTQGQSFSGQTNALQCVPLPIL